MIDIKWDSKFEVGHPRIDAEHRAFIDLIRAVSVEADRNCPKEKAMRLLLEVRKYAEFHFVSDENIMLDVGYPHYEEHRDEHAWLLRRLEHEVNLYYTDSAPLAELAHFMFDWFAMHTTVADKRSSTASPRTRQAPHLDARRSRSAPHPLRPGRTHGAHAGGGAAALRPPGIQSRPRLR